MFKKLIQKLYNYYFPIKLGPVEMTRLQMLGCTMTTEVLDLSKSEQKQIADEAQTLLSSAVLKLAIDSVKKRAANHIINEAPTAEVIFYDRFIINGASQVEDELAAYASMQFDDPNEEEFL